MTDRVVDYRLADAEARHAEAPRSFFIPPRSKRSRLRPGERAKLLLEVVGPRPGEPSAERLWVEVLERAAGSYVGVLVSTPRAITTLTVGSRLGFGPEHVVGIPEHWPLLDKNVFVSRRCHEQERRPGFVYREDPDDDRDSGWRVLVGDETAAEVDDPGNVVLVDVESLLDRWPELRPVLETDPVDGAWTWDGQAGRYVRHPES